MNIKKLLCRIGLHKWEEEPDSTQNISAALLGLFIFGRQYKCKRCNKRK